MKMFTLRGVEIVQNKKSDKKHKLQGFEVSISASDGSMFSVTRTYEDFQDLRKEINGILQDCESKTLLPNLPGKVVKLFEGKKEDEKRKKAVADFCEEILQLPDYIIKSTTVYSFFTRNMKILDRISTNDVPPVPTKTDNSQGDQTGGVVGDNPNLPRVGRRHAYEEITIEDGMPVSREERTASQELDEIDGTAAGGKTTIYATVLHKSQLTDESQAGNVEYAEVTSVRLRPSVTNSEQPASPSLSEQYANASEIGCRARIVSSRESWQYQEVVRSEQEPAVQSSSPPRVRHQQNKCNRIDQPHSEDNRSHERLNGSRDEVNNGIGGGNMNGVSEVHHPTCPIETESTYALPMKGSRRRRPKQSENGSGNDVIPPVPEVPPSPPPPTTDVVQIQGTFEDWLGDGDDVHVIAIYDYTSNSDIVHSFHRGTQGALVAQADSGWWCVRVEGKCAWVPADYWRKLNSDNHTTLCGSSWFSGKLSRSVCEELLMKHGEERQFSVRESTNRVGNYALSVKHNGRIHHFPIELTSDKKYNIGQHDFKSITRIITYYKNNPLFFDEHGHGITLGNPLVVAEGT